MLRLPFILLTILSLAASIANANSVKLELQVKNNGDIDVAGEITTQGVTASSAKMLLVPVPFNLRPNATFEAAQDVKVAVASFGTGYTLLSIIAETSGSPVLFGIKNAIKYSETPEGKAKIEAFPDYKYTTSVEKKLITQGSAVSNLDLIINLPKKYNPTEVPYRPSSITTTDNQKYVFPSISVPGNSNEEFWIVFPNPSTEDLKWAQIIVSFLFGLFTVAFHVPALKKGNLTWQIFVLLLSSIILSVSIYFAYTLAKNVHSAP